MSDERTDDPGERAGDPGDRLEELLADHREEPETPEPEEPTPFDPFAPQDPDEDQEDDEDQLPEAPLFALLETLTEEVLPTEIDRVWIFPPRRIEVGETAVVVVAAFTENEPGRRRVFAAHYTALDDSDDQRLAVDQYGTAPSDRVGRLVEEVVERIKEGPTDAPRSIEIGGKERTWTETLHTLAEEHLEARQRDRRLR